MKKLITAIVCILALAMCFTACAPSAAKAPAAQGGTLRLKVNPEIAISYDADGNVTSVEAVNEDAVAILEGYTEYEGKACKVVMAELVAQIGAAGYFVEDVDGNCRQITIEVEAGSQIPDEAFLAEVEEEVRETVTDNEWSAPIEVKHDHDDDDDDGICTNPLCKDDDCDDVDCDAGICTNPLCDDEDCDDADCDEGMDDDEDDDEDDDGEDEDEDDEDDDEDDDDDDDEDDVDDDKDEEDDD